MLYYRPDAPLRTPDQAAERDEYICNLPGVDWFLGTQGVPAQGMQDAQARMIASTFPDCAPHLK